MRIHRFDTAALAATPWKNGGGTTREIVCIPPAAGMDGFDWRVSIATIAAAGPFSAFAGVDRAIMLLDGAGVRLRSDDGRIDHRLDAPYTPFAFAGDVALDCELLGGTSDDFNVMTRRGKRRAEVCVLRGSEDIPTADSGLLLVLRGRWRLQGADSTSLEAGQGLWWERDATDWRAAPIDADAVLVAVRIESLSQPGIRTP